MNILIDRDVLVRALARAQGVINSDDPILSHVLVSASGDGVRITATDTEMTFIGDFPANVINSGAVCVPARTMYQIAKVLPDAAVSIKHNGPRLDVMVAGATQFKVVCLDAKQFVFGEGGDTEGEAAEIQAEALRWIIDRTASMVCTDDNRYGINGALLEASEPNCLRMVATDGHRLAYAQAPFTGVLGVKPDHLIPRKALAEMRKLLEGVEGSVRIGFAPRTITLILPGARFFFRLIDGVFPNYRQVVPSSSPVHSATMRRDDLFSALRRVGVLASEKARPARFDFANGSLTINTASADVGEANEKVPVTFVGPPLCIGLNLRYMQEMLGTLGSEFVRLGFGGPLAPVVVTEPNNTQSLCVIMPMRLD